MGFGRLISRSREVGPAEKGKHDNSPKLTTDFSKDKIVDENKNERKTNIVRFHSEIYYPQPYDRDTILYICCIYLSSPGL